MNSMELMELEHKTSDAIQQAKALVVNDQKSLEQANTWLGEVRRLRKLIVETFKPAKRKIDEAKAELLIQERKFDEPLRQQEEIILREKISPYLVEERKKADEVRKQAESEARKKQEDAALSAALDAEKNGVPTIQIEAILDQAATAPISIPKKEVPKADGVYMVREWHFSIDNAKLVPCEYHTIDEPKIRQVVRALKEVAVGKIPGVKVWYEDAPRKRMAVGG